MTKVKGLGLLSVLVVASMLLSVLMVGIVLNQEPTEVEKVVVQNVSVPVIVEKEVAVADPRIDDLYKDAFADEYNEIEEEAELAVLEEIEDDDYEMIEELLESTVEGFDKLKNVNVEDVDVTVTALGLDEDEDKSADVEVELKVRYTLEEGMIVVYKKTIVLNANVIFTEGDLDDSEVVFA